MRFLEAYKKRYKKLSKQLMLATFADSIMFYMIGNIEPDEVIEATVPGLTSFGVKSDGKQLYVYKNGREAQIRISCDNQEAISILEDIYDADLQYYINKAFVTNDIVYVPCDANSKWLNNKNLKKGVLSQ